MKNLFISAFAAASFIASPVHARDITDAQGRTVTIPDTVERVICSGPGCLRLLTYLRAQDMVVAVDDIERERGWTDARAYALANPQFRQLPLFGEHRGRDNPELILSLEPAPQVILKTLHVIGSSPEEISAKTGLPTVALNFGDIGANRADFDRALRLMGEVVGREERAEGVIAFIDQEIAELRDRAARSTAPAQSAYVGGVAFQGAQGLTSTEPNYPPFALLGLTNPAGEGAAAAANHAMIAKEQILAWDPALIFVDLATLQQEADAGGLHELKTDPAYQALTAVTEGEVWGVLPYNIYDKEVGAILANAWFIGTLTRPDTFEDVDPLVRADAIETFLVGKPVTRAMNGYFSGLAFRKVPLE